MKPSLHACLAHLGMKIDNVAHRLDVPPGMLAIDLGRMDVVTAVEAVVELLCRALVGTVESMAASHLRLAVEWARGQVPGGNMLLAALMEIEPHALKGFLARVLAEVPEAVALPVWGTMFFSPDEAGSMLEGIANDPRPGVREHLFSLFGMHRRIVPPGTLSTPTLPDDVHERIVRRGITDSVGKVRERAIAYAYGRGVVAWVRELIVNATRDPEPDVRQYALIALGTLADAESLQLLRDALRGEGVPEITSAIWALARRPDGVADIVALAADARAWVRNEMAAPLSDEQKQYVAATIAMPAITQALARHRARTQGGVPERGPDVQITYKK